MEPVRNHRNRIVVDAARLHRARIRKERCQTLVEGPNLLADAVAARTSIRTVFALASDGMSARLADVHGLDLLLVDQRALGRLAGTETPRGPIAIVDLPEDDLPTDRNVLVACGVSDPGNVGTLIRTAAAFGWSYAYTEGAADPWSPKTMRAGAGGQFQTPIVRLDGLSDLQGWKTVATVVADGSSLDSVGAGRIAVLVGEEASGLDEKTASAADIRVTVPLTGPSESLNAAVAAGIVVYELSKARREGSGQV